MVNPKWFVRCLCILDVGTSGVMTHKVMIDINMVDLTAPNVTGGKFAVKRGVFLWLIIIRSFINHPYIWVIEANPVWKKYVFFLYNIAM